MTKMPIKWHEEGVRNRRIHIDEERKSVKYRLERLARMEADLAFSELQLSTAKKRGLDGYDNERQASRIADLEQRLRDCDEILHMISTWNVADDVVSAIADARRAIARRPVDEMARLSREMDLD